jgi:beta-xylosidase
VILDLPSQISWGTTNAWAPYAVTRNGKYYFYFCANKNIGVAVSDSPIGPFSDPLGKPLVAAEEIKDIGGGQAIDPMVFIDDDGEAYLYFGNGSLYVAKLNDDMISLKTPLKNITPACFREAADVLKRDGIYHFTWSDDDTRSENYHVNYGTSTSPFGPIEGCNLILEKNLSLGIKGTGHHSIVKVSNRDEYYIAYHRFSMPNGNGTNREVCIDRLEFNTDGTMKKVKPALEGITEAVEL